MCGWGVGGREVIRVSTALGVREMTELTPEPCHILFSASLGSVRGRGTGEKKKAFECSHMALGEKQRNQVMRKGGRGLGQTRLIFRFGPDPVHQKVYHWLINQ